MDSKKIAVFGGAFNPVHYGHLQIAEVALQQTALDLIIWVPTFCPAHKPEADLLPFDYRMAMVQQAILPYARFAASDIERQYGGVSYAIATLAHLADCHPQASWHWLIGLDAFKTLPQWRCSAELARQCDWLIAPRDRADSFRECLSVANHFATDRFSLHWNVLSMPQIAISSSQIREHCRTGRSLKNLVPKTVQDYILLHNLYGAKQTEA
jgi:nicotinate-nucleotide adenylyltransferase